MAGFVGITAGNNSFFYYYFYLISIVYVESWNPPLAPLFLSHELFRRVATGSAMARCSHRAPLLKEAGRHVRQFSRKLASFFVMLLFLIEPLFFFRGRSAYPYLLFVAL